QEPRRARRGEPRARPRPQRPLGGDGCRQVDRRRLARAAPRAARPARRETPGGGPPRAFVAAQPVTARLLAELAPFLLVIHSQRDELGLADPELQREWLDNGGGGGGGAPGRASAHA